MKDTPEHIVTLRIRLDGNPQDISWRIASKNGKYVFGEATTGKYASYPFQQVEEVIALNFGKSYSFLVQDAQGDGINLKGATITLFDGEFGQGRVIRRVFKWSLKKQFFFWIPKYANGLKIGESCSTNSSCVSRKCRWGRCRWRPMN